MIARVLIILFVMAPFFVSVAAAADMTAGERERHSLEPLLVHPVGAFSIVVGKWMAAALLGVIGTAACVIGGLVLSTIRRWRNWDPAGDGFETALAVTLYLTRSRCSQPRCRLRSACGRRTSRMRRAT